MLVRIVKMTFQEEKVHEFLENFEQAKQKIRTFEGCEHLELLQGIHQSNVFFTYSYWQSEEALEKYRNSALFKDVWAKTKVLFAEKPSAFSVLKREVL